MALVIDLSTTTIVVDVKDVVVVSVEDKIIKVDV